MGMSTDVLGGVVAAAAGAPLPDAVRRLITQPLGMKTSFEVEDATALATPYADATPRPARMVDGQRLFYGKSSFMLALSRAFDRRSYPSGGGGMVGTAGDYLKFLEALRTGGERILSPESARALTSNQVGDLPVPQPGGVFGWSFGFAALKTPDSTMPSAPGTFQWSGVWGNSAFVDPTAKLTVVALTNTAIAGMAGRFPDDVRRAVYAR